MDNYTIGSAGFNIFHQLNIVLRPSWEMNSGMMSIKLEMISWNL